MKKVLSVLMLLACMVLPAKLQAQNINAADNLAYLELMAEMMNAELPQDCGNGGYFVSVSVDNNNYIYNFDFNNDDFYVDPSDPLYAEMLPDLKKDIMSATFNEEENQYLLNLLLSANCGMVFNYNFPGNKKMTVSFPVSELRQYLK